MKTITVLGTGIMGGGVARSLLRAGYAVRVWNRTQARAAGEIAAGAAWADTPRQAAQGADVVISFVADDTASQSVWLGDGGAFAGMAAMPDAIAVECGTMSADWMLTLAGHAAARGIAFIDSPVAGSKAAAASGQLVLLVGAAPAVLDQARPVLSAFSKDIILFGAPGAGTAYKLINNMLAASHLVALAEGLALAKRAGLDLEQVAQAAQTGAYASPIVKMKLPHMLDHDHSDVNFALRWMQKDIGYALDFAMGLDVQMPLIALTHAHFINAAQQGYGDSDMSAIVESGPV